jgi:hypothetical protein
LDPFLYKTFFIQYVTVVARTSMRTSTFKVTIPVRQSFLFSSIFFELVSVELELLTSSEHMSSPHVCLSGSYYSIVSFMCMFCRSLFVLLYFFLWTLCCLFLVDLRILITPLASSNSSPKVRILFRQSFYF